MQVSYHFGQLTPCLQWYWSQIWSKPKDQWEESSWKLPTDPAISFKLDLGSKKFFHQGDHFLRGFKNKKENPRGLASNSLKTSKLQIFCKFFAIFCKFNFINRIYMASGPQKGILLGGFIRGQVDLQWRPYLLIKGTHTWCTFLSLSDHLQIAWYTWLMDLVTCHGLQMASKM